MILKTVFDKLFKIREDAGRARANAPGADDGFDPYEKPFIDHLEDLRMTLMKMLGVIAGFGAIALLFNEVIFRFVLLPIQIAELQDKVEFLTLSPQEIFILSIKVAFFAALIVAFPLLVYLAGEFILPGLKQQEKKFVIPGVGAGFVLFLIGASFAFFVAVPIAMTFFYEYQQDRLEITNPSLLPENQTLKIDEIADKVKEGEAIAKGETQELLEDVVVEDAVQVDPTIRAQVVSILQDVLTTPIDSGVQIVYDQDEKAFIISDVPISKTPYRIGEYISLVTRMTLVFGLCFQLPVVVVILVKLELLTARTMRATRAYAWVIMLVASAIMTPPDVFTLGLLAGPLILLYEICIIIAWWMESVREKRELAEEREREANWARIRSKDPEALSENEREMLHKKEIEKYETEQAKLYLEDHNHVPMDDPHHGDPDYDPHHDESWLEDGQYWHDHEHDQEHHGDETSEDGEAGHAALESDHVEPTDDAPEAPKSELDDDVCAPTGDVVDLNSADVEALQTLPGIGPKLAQVMIDHRPFGTFDDVLRVPGISEDKLNSMIDRLSLDQDEEEEY